MNPADDPVQRVTFLLSSLNHLRANRLEYLLASILVYVTGVGSTLLTTAQGVCA
jgi:hypothetical protein